VIATIVFIIEDDIEGFKSDDDLIQIPVRLDFAGMTDNEGVLHDLDGTEVMLTLRRDNTPTYDLIAYPNPASDFVNLHLNGKTSFTSVSVFDMQGRAVQYVDGLSTKQHQLAVSHLPSGLYVVQAMHTHGVVTEVISIIR